MGETPQGFPADQFRKEHPDHTNRVIHAVQDWYQFGVNQYIIRAPLLLRESTGTFFKAATMQPENVFIGGTPFSFALKQKRDAMLDRFGRLPPAVYNAKFGDWFNSHLVNDKTPQTRQSIEQTATTHILQWLGGLEPVLQNDQGVWDQVDANLTAISEGETKHKHPVGSILLGYIQAAVIEQFMTDIYAPKDLFGPTTNKPQ